MEGEDKGEQDYIDEREYHDKGISVAVNCIKVLISRFDAHKAALWFKQGCSILYAIG